MGLPGEKVQFCMAAAVKHSGGKCPYKPIILCAPLTCTDLVERWTPYVARANQVTKSVRLRLLLRLDFKSDVWNRFGFSPCEERREGDGQMNQELAGTAGVVPY